MPTRHHHRRILIGSLLLTDGTHKNGVELVTRRQGDLNRQLLRSRPFGPLILHDGLQLEERGQRDRARRGRDVERRLRGQAEQGTEFPGEGFREIIPRALREEQSAVRAGCETGLVGEGTGQPG